MAKEKSCLNCRTIYQGSQCPACGETVFSETFKGEVEIFNSDKSIVAQNMKLKKNGRYSIKLK